MTGDDDGDAPPSQSGGSDGGQSADAPLLDQVEPVKTISSKAGKGRPEGQFFDRRDR